MIANLTMGRKPADDWGEKWRGRTYPIQIRDKPAVQGWEIDASLKRVNSQLFNQRREHLSDSLIDPSVVSGQDHHR